MDDVEPNGNGVRYTTKEMFAEIKGDIKELRSEVAELREQVDKAAGMGIVVRWIVVPVLVAIVTAAVLLYVGGAVGAI